MAPPYITERMLTNIICVRRNHVWWIANTSSMLRVASRPDDTCIIVADRSMCARSWCPCVSACFPADGYRALYSLGAENRWTSSGKSSQRVSGSRNSACSAALRRKGLVFSMLIMCFRSCYAASPRSETAQIRMRMSRNTSAHTSYRCIGGTTSQSVRCTQ